MKRATGRRDRWHLRPVAAGVAAGMLALVAASCGGSSSGPTATASVAGTQTTTAGQPTVATRTVDGLGTVLVDSSGRTLYVFAPDKHSRVTCTGSCAAIWPPLRQPNGTKPAAAGQARPSLLGSDPDPSGGRVVTYNGWPLYTYVGDHAPGSARGQALNANGGAWYAISAAGNVIHTKPKQTSTGGYSGGGYG